MGKKILSSVMMFFLVVVGVWAGGWNNMLIGCRAISMGGAFVGIADDASAVYYNPAGLAFQRENLNVVIGGFYVWPSHEYTLPTGSNAQSHYNVSLPQVFFSYRYSDRLTLAFGAYSPYATGGVDWKEADLGFPLKSYLGILSLTPSLSYLVNDRFSLGFHINFYVGALEVNTVAVGQGPVKQDEKGSAVSAGLGLMYRLSDRSNLGISIRGPAQMKLTGKTEITTFAPGLGNISLDLDSETRFTLPWDVEVGLAYRLTENLLFSMSGQYTFWSTLDRIEKTIKNVPFMDVPTQGDVKQDEVLNFEDIFILRTGMEYRLPNGLMLRGGFGWDRAAAPEETLSPNNIDVDKFTLLGGIGYRMGRTQIDFAFIRALGKERQAERSFMGFPLTESYNLSVTIVGLSVTFNL